MKVVEPAEEGERRDVDEDDKVEASEGVEHWVVLPVTLSTSVAEGGLDCEMDPLTLPDGETEPLTDAQRDDDCDRGAVCVDAALFDTESVAEEHRDMCPLCVAAADAEGVGESVAVPLGVGTRLIDTVGTPLEVGLALSLALEETEAEVVALTLARDVCDDDGERVLSELGRVLPLEDGDVVTRELRVAVALLVTERSDVRVTAAVIDEV